MPFDNWSHWAVTDGVVGKWDYTPFNVTATRESHAFNMLLLHDPTPHCPLRVVIKMEQGRHLVSPGPHLQSAFPSCLTTKLQLLVYDSQETTWTVSSTRAREPPWPFSCTSCSLRSPSENVRVWWWPEANRRGFPYKVLLLPNCIGSVQTSVPGIPF